MNKSCFAGKDERKETIAGICKLFIKKINQYFVNNLDLTSDHSMQESKTTPTTVSTPEISSGMFSRSAHETMRVLSNFILLSLFNILSLRFNYKFCDYLSRPHAKCDHIW